MIDKAPYPPNSDLGPDLVGLRDAIVQSVYDGSPSPETQPITAWVEESGGDNLLGRFIDTAVEIVSIRYGDVLTEDAFRGSFGLDKDENGTDEERVEFTRNTLESCVEPGGYLQKGLYSYRLADSGGREAFLGCVISGSGFDNSLGFNWWGPYVSEDDFLRAMKDMGYITAQCVDNFSDEDLLRLFAKCSTDQG